MIELDNVTVVYSQKPAIWNVCTIIPEGKIVGIIGPNGAGKSTLIKAIMGLLPISSGTIKLFNKPLNEVRKRVSYVPQRSTVDWDFPASVLDIVKMGCYANRGLFKPLTLADKKLALECIDKVKLNEYVDRQISQLSGGQQQRVFLARALAQQADIYLMDEPFAGIDATTEKTILSLLQEMQKNGKTIVIVHHDLQTAYQYFDWVLLLNTRLVAAGDKNEVMTTELLQETYGGKLTILSKVGNLLKEKEFSIKPH